jgi:chromosome segregation protein
MQANLNRLNDLTAELRRQLKPLGKQAEVARRAASIQADLRDAKIRLLADDLATIKETLDREIADETALRERRQEVEAEYEQVQTRLAEIEAALAEDAPVLAQAQETFLQLSTLTERMRATHQLAVERWRNLTVEVEEERPGRDPDELAAEAEALREQEHELRVALAEDQARLNEAIEGRQQMGTAPRRRERALVAAVRAIADRREGLAKLVGQVNAMRTRSSAAADEIARLDGGLAEAQDRAVVAQEDYELAADGASEADRGTTELDERHAVMVQRAEAIGVRLKELSDLERGAEKEAAQWKAREEALALGLQRKDGAGALLASGGRVKGCSVASRRCSPSSPGSRRPRGRPRRPGRRRGGVRCGQCTGGDRAAQVRRRRPGRAARRRGRHAAKGDRPALPEGARWALDLVGQPGPHARGRRAAALDVVFAPDLTTARTIVSYAPSCVR